MKKLSIIVPIYNAEKYMRSCIDSILNQTYSNFELLLVDDGSKDSSGAICDEYQIIDSRVKVFHKQNGGCSSARNMGIDYSQGEYIAFVDADDVLDKDMYEILVENLISTDSDVSACSFVREYNPSSIFPSTNNKEKPRVYRGNDIYISMTGNDMSIEGFVWNKVWKKWVIGNQRFRDDVAIVDDAVFSWEALKKVKQVCYVNLPMYHYLIIPTSITRNSSMEKYMKALYGYEIMIEDSKSIDSRVTHCLTLQYLGWNMTALSQLSNQDHPDAKIYQRIVNNIRNNRSYLKYLPFKIRISLYAGMLGLRFSNAFYRIRNKVKTIR